MRFSGLKHIGWADHQQSNLPRQRADHSSGWHFCAYWTCRAGSRGGV